MRTRRDGTKRNVEEMPIYLDKFIFAVFYRLDLLIALPERLSADTGHS